MTLSFECFDANTRSLEAYGAINHLSNERNCNWMRNFLTSTCQYTSHVHSQDNLPSMPIPRKSDCGAKPFWKPSSPQSVRRRPGLRDFHNDSSRVACSEFVFSKLSCWRVATFKCTAFTVESTCGEKTRNIKPMVELQLNASGRSLCIAEHKATCRSYSSATPLDIFTTSCGNLYLLRGWD